MEGSSYAVREWDEVSEKLEQFVDELMRLEDSARRRVAEHMRYVARLVDLRVAPQLRKLAEPLASTLSEDGKRLDAGRQWSASPTSVRLCRR